MVDLPPCGRCITEMSGTSLINVRAAATQKANNSCMKMNKRCIYDFVLPCAISHKKQQEKIKKQEEQIMILELRDIRKSFGSKQVLDQISFQAEGGKAFGLLGRNGAGKTTSIRILMDVFPADGGSVLID